MSQKWTQHFANQVMVAPTVLAQVSESTFRSYVFRIFENGRVTFTSPPMPLADAQAAAERRVAAILTQFVDELTIRPCETCGHQRRKQVAG